jgi:chemotaxis-related protein WspB
MLVLTFQIGPETVGLDIQYVREVIPRVRLQPLIHAPSWLSGVFFYRGRVIPVVDVNCLAGYDTTPEHLSSRIILVSNRDTCQNDSLWGLLAAQVAELREVAVREERLGARASFSPARNDPDQIDFGTLATCNQGLLRVLDPNHLLSENDRQRLWAILESQ